MMAPARLSLLRAFAIVWQRLLRPGLLPVRTLWLIP